MSKVLPWVVTLLVLAALLVVGLVGAARDWNAVGLGFIFGALAVCFLVALTHERMGGYKLGFSGKGVQLDVTLEKEVRSEIAQTGLAGLSATYAFVHNQLAEDKTSQGIKVKLQDQLVKIAQDNAFTKPLSAEEIEQAVKEGSPGERVLAFGLLTSNPDLATAEALLEGINHSKSGNEQYHAMKAAEKGWQRLAPADRKAIRDAIDRSPWIAGDPDRQETADSIRKLPLT
jgi:hypothetical protein